MEQQTTVDLPVWDLTDLYQGADDVRIDRDLDQLEQRAQAFEQRYRGRIAQGQVSAVELKQALDEYEWLARAQGKPGNFAQLHFSTDTTDAARGALTQKVKERGSRMATHVIFFTLEVGKIPEEHYLRLSEASELAPYRHYLDYERSLSRYHLSEPEEKILEETANSRGRAFRRLFTEITSRMSFRMVVDGKEKELTQSELLAYNYDPDREVRRAASVALAQGLKPHAHVLTFIMNTLLHEKQVMDRIRGFEEPEDSRHLGNELERAHVDTMVRVVADNFDLVTDYYRLKARLLGIEGLTHYDRYAPLEKERVFISFDQARDIVVQAFGDFSPRMAELTRPFFSERWIDAPVKAGKRGGAFCAGVTPDHHPYVLLNYTGKPRDVMTLAHELGHGVHDRLAAKQHMLDYHPVLPMAETASTFGELLVFEKLNESLDSRQKRLGLRCEKLEDTFATVFRQVAMYRFEQRIHRERRSQGELTTEQLNALWQQSMQEMFGDSLTLGEDHQWTWLYIPHIVQTPFYVYAYAFGELLVLSLFARYKQEGQAFIDKYFHLLAAGGSRRPAELLGGLGIDISRAEFWQGGCDLIRQNIREAQELAAAGQGKGTE
ncbi:MAG: M3 family oligoendopeptidase [Armatimonadetes bacterium]|nr:M3 family oligoendopeptidase [Armatimonadota bacterium]